MMTTYPTCLQRSSISDRDSSMAGLWLVDCQMLCPFSGLSERSRPSEHIAKGISIVGSKAGTTTDPRYLRKLFVEWKKQVSSWQRRQCSSISDGDSSMDNTCPRQEIRQFSFSTSAAWSPLTEQINGPRNISFLGGFFLLVERNFNDIWNQFVCLSNLPELGKGVKNHFKFKFSTKFAFRADEGRRQRAWLNHATNPTVNIRAIIENIFW